MTIRTISSPPVPAELEASIRIKRRSVWLPWEAEAIRKIERWREDLYTITRYWAGAGVHAAALKRLPIAALFIRTEMGFVESSGLLFRTLEILVKIYDHESRHYSELSHRICTIYRNRTNLVFV